MHAVSISKWKPIVLVNDEDMYGAFNGIPMYFMYEFSLFLVLPLYFVAVFIGMV